MFKVLQSLVVQGLRDVISVLNSACMDGRRHTHTYAHTHRLTRQAEKIKNSQQYFCKWNSSADVCGATSCGFRRSICAAFCLSCICIRLIINADPQ